MRKLGIESGKARPGEMHGNAKLRERDVIRLRNKARHENPPNGWMNREAEKLGVSRAAIIMAIGGDTWAHLRRPAPVAAGKRSPNPRAAAHPQKRPLCQWCGGRKYEGAAKDCRSAFHRVDHRTGNLWRPTQDRPAAASHGLLPKRKAK